MDLDEVGRFDFESFLDLISERLTGSELLMNIDYDVVGHEGNTLHMKVGGDPSEIRGMREDEEDEEEETVMATPKIRYEEDDDDPEEQVESLTLTVDIDGTPDDLADAMEHIAKLIREGYTSGYEPRWDLSRE